MFAEILANIETLLNGLLDPVTNGIVSKIFDFILNIYNTIAG